MLWQDSNAGHSSRQLAASRLGLDVENPSAGRVVEAGPGQSKCIREDIVPEPQSESTVRIRAVPRSDVWSRDDVDGFLFGTEREVVAELIAQPNLHMADSAVQVTRVIVPDRTVRRNEVDNANERRKSGHLASHRVKETAPQTTGAIHHQCTSRDSWDSAR